MNASGPIPLSTRALRFALVFLLVNAVLVASRWVVAGGPGHPWIALEAVILAGAFAALRRRRTTAALAAVSAVVLLVVGVLGLGDAATRLSLGRPLNLYLDVRLLASVHHLLSGAVGPLLAHLAAVGAALAALALAWGVALLLLSLSGPRPVPQRAASAPNGPAWTRDRSTRFGAVAIVAAGAAGVAGADLPALDGRVGTPGVDVAMEQARYLGEMMRERERFAEEVAAARTDYGGHPGLLERLEGTDVLLAFIESYGLSAVVDERYAPLVGARLDELTERMAEASLHVVTGTLTAPVQGGQSWLAHGSVLSGLWLENQLRHDLLLARGPQTLIDDFRTAGHRTVAVMPAITMAWPEGERFGYDDIFVHRNMGYRGPPLNWVTMPDQYTWSFLERTLGRSERPVFAAIGLISSHAPWTPILPVLEDWEAIGDGSVFGPWEDAGERPAELWRNTDRVREHYAMAVDYALNAMIGYAERYVDERTLLIALGDHQPAPLVTGDGAGRAVPVHVISGDPALLEPFLEWGFVEGGRPDPARPAPPMSAFRHWFVPAFSDPGPSDGGG